MLIGKERGSARIVNNNETELIANVSILWTKNMDRVMD